MLLTGLQTMTLSRRQLLQRLGASAGVGAASIILGECSLFRLKTDLTSDLYRKREEQENEQPTAHRQPLTLPNDQQNQDNTLAVPTEQTTNTIDNLVREGPLAGLDPTRNIMYLALDIGRLFGIDVPDSIYQTVDTIREAASSSIFPELQPEAKLRAVDRLLFDTLGYKVVGRIDPLTREMQGQVTTLSEGLDSQVRQLDCDTSSIIFIGIGEDLGWPVQGVRVPYHFFVRWALSDQNAHRPHPYLNWDPVQRNKFMDLAFWVNYRVAKAARDNGTYMKSLSRKQMISTIFGQVGRSLSKKGEYEKALTAYSRAIALDDTNVVAWCNRGKVLNRLQRYDESIASLLEATKRDPILFEAYLGLTFAYQKLGRTKEAQEAEKTAKRVYKLWHNNDS